MSDQLRIGVHPSVDAFDPETLCEELADIEHDVVPTDATTGYEEFDGVVTLDHDRQFLETPVRWVHFISAGVDHVPLEEYDANDIDVTNSRGVHGECMAENAVGLMITLAHRLHEFRDDQRARNWNPDTAWDEKFTLRDESVTVVGLGAIGGTIADYADKVGMTVYGVKRTPEPVAGVDRVYASDDIAEPLSNSRFVVLAVPLSEQTRHLIGRDQLAAMSEEAYLVNVSRGEIVDQAELVDALGENRLAGAALDVFAEEPLPKDSPLWAMENVVITPHVSGAFSTYHRGVADLVRRNVGRLTTGDTLVNRVR